MSARDVIPSARRRALVFLAEQGAARTSVLSAATGVLGGSITKTLRHEWFTKADGRYDPWTLTDAGRTAYALIPADELPALRVEVPPRPPRAKRDVEADRRLVAAAIRGGGVMWGADLAAAAGVSLSRFWAAVTVAPSGREHPWFTLDRGGYRLTARGLAEAFTEDGGSRPG